MRTLNVKYLIQVPNARVVVESELLRLEELCNAVVVAHEVGQGGIVLLAELLGLGKVHWNANVEVAGVAD